MKSIFKINTLLICAFLFQVSSIHAQTSINSASNKAVLNQEIFEYSIGEMPLISTTKTTSFVLTQGYLQPYHINVEATTSVSTESDVQGNIKVYPNPTNNSLNIQFENSNSQQLIIQLFDAQGKIFYSNTMSQSNIKNVIQIDMSQYADGNYFLNLIRTDLKGNSYQSTFKILKTNQ